MSRYPSAATLTKPSTAGRRSSARQATHSDVAGTPQLSTNRVLEPPDLRRQDLLRHVDALSRGGEARFLGDRDEITKVPYFNVHRGLNPNHRASPANGDKLRSGRLTQQ